MEAPLRELAAGLPGSTRLAPTPRITAVTDLQAARGTLLAELREHSLVVGEVTLSGGARAEYYVDARRALLRPPAFLAAGELIADAAAACLADA